MKKKLLNSKHLFILILLLTFVIPYILVSSFNVGFVNDDVRAALGIQELGRWGYFENTFVRGGIRFTQLALVSLFNPFSIPEYWIFINAIFPILTLLFFYISVFFFITPFLKKKHPSI